MIETIQTARTRWALNYLSSFPDISRESSGIISWIVKNGKKCLGLDIPDDFDQFEQATKFEDEKDRFSQHFVMLGDENPKRLPEALQEERRKRHANMCTLLQNTLEAPDQDRNPRQSHLHKSVALISEALGLDALEQDMVLFYADLVLNDMLDKTRFDAFNEDNYYERASRLFKTDEDTLRSKLEPSARLRASYLLDYSAYDWSSESKTRTKTSAYSVDSATLSILRENHSSATSIVERLIGASATTDLEIGNYRHIDREVRNFIETVQGALKDKETKGRVFLIYGDPGTGKTQLLGLVAKMLGIPCYLTGQLTDSTQLEKDGDKERIRIRALLRADYLARAIGKPMIIAADEAEDFCRDTNSKENPGKGSKGVLNYVLDNMASVTILVTNRIDLFDPAYARRMAPQLFVPKAPIGVRMSLIQEKCLDSAGVNLNDGEAYRLANLARSLSPAELERALRAAAWRESVRGDKQKVIQAVEINLTQIAMAQNAGTPPLAGGNLLTSPAFDFSLCAASQKLQPVSDQLINLAHKDVDLSGLNLSLRGPEGAGKKTFLRWLGHEMGFRTTEISYSAFISSLTQQFNNDAFARYLMDAAMERNFVIMTGADPVLALENCSAQPFFKRMREYPYPFAITVNARDSAKLAEPPKSQEKDQLEDAIQQAAQIGETVVKSMMGAFSAAGLPMPGGMEGQSDALREFAFNMVIPSMAEPQIQTAFQRYFGVEATGAACAIPGLTPYDFQSIARRLSFYTPEQKTSLALTRELCQLKNITLQQAEQAANVKNGKIILPPQNVAADKPLILH